ncbi:MAG: sulfotransferase [Leptolyngbyaceae cyanobacterium]
MSLGKNLPSFLIIGAYKSGTTALYRYFDQHPEVYMSPLKETNFFALEGATPSYCGPGDAKAPTNRLSITSLDAYQAQFDDISDERAIGEASPMYLYSSTAAERIHSYLPQVKLIAILRQPATRAFSNFLHLVRDGREKSHNFLGVWNREQKRIDAHWAPIWHIRQHGLYYQQLRRYFDRFDAAQIKVVLHEDLVEQPDTMLKDLFDYIGVDTTFHVDFSHRPNQSGIPKNRIVRGVARRLLVMPLQATGNQTFTEWGESISQYFLYRPEITAEQKHEINQFYRDDILQLQSLIDRDLSHWIDC